MICVYASDYNIKYEKQISGRCNVFQFYNGNIKFSCNFKTIKIHLLTNYLR